MQVDVSKRNDHKYLDLGVKTTLPIKNLFFCVQKLDTINFSWLWS